MKRFFQHVLYVIPSVIRRDSAYGDFADAKFRFRTAPFTQNDTAGAVEIRPSGRSTVFFAFGFSQKIGHLLRHICLLYMIGRYKSVTKQPSKRKKLPKLTTFFQFADFGIFFNQNSIFHCEIIHRFAVPHNGTAAHAL